MGDYTDEYDIMGERKVTDEPERDVVTPLTTDELESIKDGGVVELSNGDTISGNGKGNDTDWYIGDGHIEALQDGYYVNLSGLLSKNVSLVLEDEVASHDGVAASVFELFQESDDPSVRRPANELLQALGYSVEKDVEYRLEEL